LLLGYDGLDQLWSEADYLGTWYSDPDAEIDSRYDKHTLNHNNIIQQRLKTRKFKARTLGLRRPLGAAAGQQAFRLVPEPVGERYANFGTNDDDPTEIQDGYQQKRNELIDHFNITWEANNVLWLPFPGSRVQ
jgi:hypothetical protein